MKNKYKRWTEHEDNRVKFLVSIGTGAEQIAKELGRSRASVYYRRDTLKKQEDEKRKVQARIVKNAKTRKAISLAVFFVLMVTLQLIMMITLGG